MAELLRETFFGAIANAITKNKAFPYPEDQPGFQIPRRYLDEKSSPGRSSPSPSSTSPSGLESGTPEPSRRSSGLHAQDEQASTIVSEPSANNAKGAYPEGRSKTGEIIVTWYDEQDPANPQNWSSAKKYLVTFCVCFLTFSIYIGSAIFTPGIPEIMAEFATPLPVVELGLTFFVFAYGLGPLLWAPMSEDIRYGRMRIYILTLAVFVLFQLPTALAPNIGTLLAFRFLGGFFGSPALATGGATLADIYAPHKVPYAISIWAVGAVGGPVLGPLIGAAMVDAESWRWDFWFLMILNAACLVLLIFCFPETSTPYILHKRAQRLRRLTGRDDIVTLAELEVRGRTKQQLLIETLVRPLELTIREPIVFLLDLYIALVYILLYLFFESFVIVFNELYHFTLVESGLAYFGFLVGLFIVLLLFWFIVWKVIEPGMKAEEKAPPEMSLTLAMIGSFCIPICLFWFGWTSQAHIHWISPIAATVFYSIGTFLLFQSALGYLTQAYPRYAASVLASNDLFRSTLGSVFPIFGRAFFANLGPSYAPVAWGSTLLGVISVIMIPIPFVLFKVGHKFRGKSKYAD